MANPEHLATLKRGVEVWNRWREDNPSVQPDLVGANLETSNLQGVNLCEAKLSNANLQSTVLNQANFVRASLDQATLRWAWLQDAHFEYAHLFKVNLEDAHLERANLKRANLSEANLHGANLEDANLRSTDLNHANLKRANLFETNLVEANLQGASISHALIGWTMFGNTDLRETEGLDTVEHKGPSTLGIDSLYRSQGNIPEVFLRGCGVPDSLIEYARSLIAANNPIEFYSCFISYSHADTSFARRLHDALQGRGIRCWLDEHQLLPGHSIYDEIDRGIRLWDKILLCASEHSLTSWWVDNEIDKAFTKEQQLMQDRGAKVRALIPLNLDNALWQWQDGKADQVRARLAADFTGWEHDNAKFEREFERLVKALRTDEGREVPPPSRL